MDYSYSERDFAKSDSLDSEHKFYTSLIHREDSMSLYGFFNKESRDIFQILLSVSGVGAKMALALLNECEVCDLISFVIDGNFKELTRAKGVGPKLAQKIILELKDKVAKDFLPTSSAMTGATLGNVGAVTHTSGNLLRPGAARKRIGKSKPQHGQQNAAQGAQGAHPHQHLQKSGP